MKKDTSNHSFSTSVPISVTKRAMLSKTLENLADIVLEMDAKNESAEFEYSDDDAVNALMIFNSVVANRLIHAQMRANVPPKRIDKRVARYAKNLNNCFVNATGIIPKDYFDSLK